MVNRQGYVNRYQRSGKSFTVAATFGDARDRVLTAFNGVPYGEMGLLGLALHPRFVDNGFVFLYYSAAGTQGTAVEARLSRFLSRDGGLTIDMSSEEVLIRTPRTTQYHWGGTLGFGADGLLYLGIGEGNYKTKSPLLDNLFGKMIRIDVDAAPGYRIPPANPYVGTLGALPEIYASGFRNPWKWSFDRASGTLWAGDVGANDWEEINHVVKGGKYGWPTREGAHCTAAYPGCSTVGLIDPVVEYFHDPSAAGAAVIGGYVYSGTSIPSLAGTYLYADAYGKVFALRYDSLGKPAPQLLVESSPVVSTFAQDETGEIYLATAGNVYLIAPAAAPQPSTFPERLSLTGCMNASNPALPGPALIPYGVNSPLWSDGAGKERWFALPDGKTILRQPDGDWDLPVGSVTVKSFRIKGRLVETRLLVRHDDGDWAGYSYEWNDAQTDAFLLPAGKVKTVEGQQWTYPSRSQCLGCHTEAAGRTLGLETAQLNRDQFYPGTGRTANQLSTLDAIGMFSAPLTVSPSQMDKLADPANTAQGLESRARSYLHANCAMCHRPNGPGQGPEDFRYSLPTTSINAVNVIPTQSSFGLNDPRLIYPGKPERSIVSHRLQTLELGRMPPLGTAMVDTGGVALINQWIRSALGMGSPDSDNDGFADNVDNCRSTPNPSQLDTDGDGIGNMCDADFNN
ncbi:MAG: PQQ-dependent sugar dehydrogenase, partial [Burkholderiaceae bacterium]|nr:PQQ-dependent sugar dehydrogenase [Burkholderiaceae bacterium]